jgi:electron transfer flavoprotein alpha subunit
MAGCLKSKVIVAINNNKEAPIYRFSHYGVVGEYGEVLKAFNHEIRRSASPG